MTDRGDDISFDPKTWLGEPSTPLVAITATPAATVSNAAVVTPMPRGRMALAFGLSALLLITAAGGAYLMRAPLLAAPAAVLR